MTPSTCQYCGAARTWFNHGVWAMAARYACGTWAYFNHVDKKKRWWVRMALRCATGRKA